MMVKLTRPGLLALGLLCIGCHGLSPDRAVADVPGISTIYVVSHGWHAGIVVRRSDIPDTYWPEKQDFPNADYLEVGWGDSDYYQSLDPGLVTTLKAGLWPTVSVLHVVGFRGPVGAYFPHSQVIALPVSRYGLAQLIDFIDAAHDRPDRRPLTSLGRGLYGDSHFYPARGQFHLFNNCNGWTARALRAAGYAVDESMTVGGLLDQLERDTAITGNPPR